MSNPNSFLALPVCPPSTAVEEPSNHVLFQDIDETQNLPRVSSPKGLNSNMEVQNPPNPTQSQDDPGYQNNNEETNMPPAPRRSTRHRSLSLQKAITIYEEAVRAIQLELAEFEAQNTSSNLMKICTPQISGLDTRNCACESKRSF